MALVVCSSNGLVLCDVVCQPWTHVEPLTSGEPQGCCGKPQSEVEPQGHVEPQVKLC